MNKKDPVPEAENQMNPFMLLVLTIASGALQGLGIGIPTGEGTEPEPNLELAQHSIDQLQLFSEKTKGNLDSDEEKFLSQMLHQLRSIYVEAANKPTEEAT